jgi:capsular exopolysaccharide synthesis family protein
VNPPGVAPPPRAPGLDERLVGLRPSGPAELEPYVTVRHVLEEAQRRAGVSVVAVTSALPGDGRTTTAINVAGVLGRGGDRVLLIDADLRDPAVARHLLPGSQAPGLVDAVVDGTLTVHDVVVSPPHLPFDVLPAGRSAAAPYDVVRAARFAALLDQARGRYAFVVLDTPPLVGVPDGRIVQAAVDGVLLVVAANRTPRKRVADALRLIDPARLIGVVFNGDTGRRRGADPRGRAPGPLDRMLDTLRRRRR